MHRTSYFDVIDFQLSDIMYTCETVRRALRSGVDSDASCASSCFTHAGVNGASFW